jgi:hypothetical protein
VFALVRSRFAAWLGLPTLALEAMISPVTTGAPQATNSLLGATSFFAKPVFRIGEGTLIDTMPRRQP